MAEHLSKQVTRYTRAAPTKTQKRRAPVKRDYAITGSAKMKKLSEAEAKAAAAEIKKKEREKKEEEKERKKIFEEELAKRKVKMGKQHDQMRQDYAAEYTPPGVTRPPRTNVRRTPRRPTPNISEICSE